MISSSQLETLLQTTTVIAIHYGAMIKQKMRQIKSQISDK